MHAEGQQTSGFTLIEILIGLAIFAVVTSGIFIGYQSVLDIVQSSQYNAAALSVIESQVELVRNMRYEDVGTVGGVPAGKIPAVQDITLDDVPYELHTFIRNIDDPFDGMLGGNPADLDPADYKLVELQIICEVCVRYDLVKLVTYIAPKNLESASKAGNLTIGVIDATGQPISGAMVRVTNPFATPAIDLTDITDVNGQLQLVGVATGSAVYHIEASKAGYSNDQTYPPGAPENPVKPDATVATQQLTQVTLAIDRVSSVTVQAHDAYCVAPPGMDFLLTGATLIGTLPDVPRYSVNHTVGASGTLTVNNLAFDAYTFQPTDATYDIAGVATGPQLIVDPNTTVSSDWFVASRSQSGLSVSIIDTNGMPIDEAAVRVTGTGYDETHTSGRWTFSEGTWSDATITARSADLDVGTVLTLTDLGGTHATASQWLISRTIDFGTTDTTFGALSWIETEPAGTDVRFQVAANNDNTTWNYVGPDGTAGTYFTMPGTVLPSGLSGKRYLRYQVFLETTNETVTPTADNVSLVFGSTCVTAGQAYFNGLQSTTYTVEVTKTGYVPVTEEVIVSGTWQRTSFTLTSQ